LLRWFDLYNRNRRYTDQVRPFGFMTALHEARQAHGSTDWEPEAPTSARKRRRVRPIAPYQRDPASAATVAFDRETGDPVPVQRLATYREVLAQYHLHPESKFLDGDFTDRGPTRRRHIQATSITYIGKEANRWEEQFFVGLDEEAVISYGSAPERRGVAEERVRLGVIRVGQKTVARAARMSLRDVNRAAREPARLSLSALDRLDRVLAKVAERMDRPSQ
jgi:hypothetical protein